MKNYPLLLLTLTITILLALTGILGRETVYAQYADDIAKTPAEMLPLLGFTDGVYPWQTVPIEEFIPESPRKLVRHTPAGDEVPEVPAEEEETEMKEPDVSANSEKADISGNSKAETVSGNAVVLVDAPGDTVGVEEIHEEVSESAYIEVPEEPVREEEEVYTFTSVSDDYFADAVFIGDSRTVGLYEYCKELSGVATFYAKTSLTIYGCLNDPFLKEGDRKMTIEEALSVRQFKKVYLMLGLNEMGTGNNASFIEAYYRVVARILELQPDAILYVEGLMHVTENKSGRDKIFNNENINARNDVLRLLADNQRIFYIDMNEATDDENGNLTAELSFDGVHLYARAYENWHQFLLTHAIVK